MNILPVPPWPLWFKISYGANMMAGYRLLSRLALMAMALAMFSVSSLAQTSTTTGKAVFSGDRKASTFAFEWREGLIFLPVRINGSRPLSFVLDTGSTRILIDRKLAADLGLKASGTGSLQGAGAGRIPIEFIHDVGIALPGVESAGYDLSTADLQPLEAVDGGKVDGIIGYPFFSRFVITVDFEAKQLTLTSPEAFHPNSAGQALPIELRNKWPFVKGELVLPGPVTVQDSFLIDSGSSDAVDHPIVMTLQSRVPSKSGVGLGAEVQGATARATSFHLGRYAVEGPLVACCGGTDATSKLIGSEILRRFTVSFDYSSSRIFITPNSYYGEGSLSPAIQP
ncbi:MAG TPA: retropepsin-like aspartic protease [Terriglobales bacterium]